MTSYVTPKKNSPFIYYLGLVSTLDSSIFKVDPTIATGDFKVSIDGGAKTNLETLPILSPASGDQVKISLSADEMNGDNITVHCLDADGNEWSGVILNIQTSEKQIDDLAIPTDITGVTLDANIVAIDSNATSASNLAISADSMITGNAITGTLNTDKFTTDLTSTVDNIYAGRIVIFTSGIMTREVAAIAYYDGGTKLITLATPLTNEPAHADSFIIV